VRGLVKGYKVDDDQSYLDKIAARLSVDRRLELWSPQRINGFCMAAKTETWWLGAHTKEFVFDSGRKFKLTKNEDELQGRWEKKGIAVGIVPGSFVFHYRGVSRKGAVKGREGKGHFRKD